jgi:hypothetical protein
MRVEIVGKDRLLQISQILQNETCQRKEGGRSGPSRATRAWPRVLERGAGVGEGKRVLDTVWGFLILAHSMSCLASIRLMSSFTSFLGPASWNRPVVSNAAPQHTT